MKNKNIQSFGEFNENLNISDVMNSINENVLVDELESSLQKIDKIKDMNELELIKITQYSFAILGKGLPKSCVLKGGESKNVVEFYKYDRGDLWNEYGRPVGFYFKDGHKYELRSKYDGYELISFTGKELDEVLNCL